jgi:hypothetical protein
MGRRRGGIGRQQKGAISRPFFIPPELPVAAG